MLIPGASIGKGLIQTDWSWILVFILSLILGHFLHAFSDPLDGLAARFYLYGKTKAYLEAATKSIRLPKEVSPASKNYFYYVFSFIRIHNPVAVAELERQAGDYKFFRSLVLLSLLDIPLSVLDPFIGRDALPIRLSALLIAVCLTAVVTKLLFEWTYQLAFELYLIQKEIDT